MFWEDSWHGLSPLPGGGEPDYKSVHEEGHRSGTYVQGEAKGTGGLRRVRRDVGGRILVESFDDSTWEGGGETVAMDHTSRGGRNPDLLDVLPGKGRTAEMPSGGVPRHSGYEDRNAGALIATECPQHRGDSGGRKLPPPTVLPVQHTSPPAGVERAAPGHRAVQKGGGTKETTTGGGGDAG